MLTSFCTHGLLISWISVFRKSHELPSLATIRLISHRNYWKNLFGCRPRQVQKNGQWYAKNPGRLSCAGVEICQEALFEVQTFLKLTEPGVMAAAWDDEGITATGPTSQ